MTRSSYHEAGEKVRNSKRLSPFCDLLIKEGDEAHLDWILSSSDEVIMKYLEALYDEPGTIF